MLIVLLDTLAYQQNPLAYKASNKNEAKRLFSVGISAYKPDRKEEDQVELEDELTIRAAMVWYPIRNVHYLLTEMWTRRCHMITIATPAHMRCVRGNTRNETAYRSSWWCARCWHM